MALPRLPQVPLVSAVVTAYNVEAFIGAAIDSALSVDWPADKLEIIVVDDGSTDGTAAILAGYGDRIRLITQPNLGCLSAMTTALRAVRGEVIAFLDGDDEWPADKLHTQVSVLQKRPEVGLVYGDMEVIDTGGAITHPSYFARRHITPLRGRVLGALLPASFILTGATVVRAELRSSFCPIPNEAAAYDWYVASRVAEVAEVDYVDAVVSRYRFRGNNLYLGAGVEQQCGNDLRGDIFTRYLLTNLDMTTVTTGQMMAALKSAKTRRELVGKVRGATPESLLSTGPWARTRSRAELTRAKELLRRGNLDGAIRAAIRSIAHDPEHLEPIQFLESTTERLLSAAQGFSQRELVAQDAPAQEMSAAPEPLTTRRIAIRADAAELVARPELLRAWAATFSDRDDVTLVALAEHCDHDRIADALMALACEIGLDEERAPDIVLQACSDPGDVAVEFAAFYGRSSNHRTRPAYDESGLDELRARLAS